MFFVSVASKGFRFSVSPLFSALTGKPTSVDSKRVSENQEMETGRSKMVRKRRARSEGGRRSEEQARVVSGASKFRVDTSRPDQDSWSRFNVNKHEGE